MTAIRKKNIYLCHLRARRLWALCGNAVREFRRNGIGGVVRRFRILAVNPRHTVFSHAVDEWVRRGKKWQTVAIAAPRPAKRIGYIVPGLGISGGIAIVLNHVTRLRARGYDAFVITMNSEKESMTWFGTDVPVVAATRMLRAARTAPTADVLVATHWSTVFVMDLIDAPRKAYFVQSDERRFHPDRVEDIALIEATYRMPCEYITEAKWIKRWLADEFGHVAHYVPNGLNEAFLAPATPLAIRGRRPRILLEGPIVFWAKGMYEAYAAVAGLDADIWIVSSNGHPPKSWRYDRFLEKVPMGDMAAVYASCDIFVKLSRIEGFFGPPLEAMAQGCAVVVAKVTGYDEYVRDEENALVVDADDRDGIRAALVRLMGDSGLRARLGAAGVATAAAWGWDGAIDRLERFVHAQDPEPVAEGTPYRYTEEIVRLRTAYALWRKRYEKS